MIEINDRGSSTVVKKEVNENIRIMGLLQLAGILIPNVGGWLLVLIFYIIKKDSFSVQEKEVFKEIINFHLSFLLYFVVSTILIVLIVGILILPILFIIYAILIVVSTIKYIMGDVYRFPMTIRFI